MANVMDQVEFHIINDRLSSPFEIIFNFHEGDVASLNLKPCKGRLADRGKFEGVVKDASGAVVYKLYGSCMDKVQHGSCDYISGFEAFRIRVCMEHIPSLLSLSLRSC